jgi:hypothetical protein
VIDDKSLVLIRDEEHTCLICQFCHPPSLPQYAVTLLGLFILTHMLKELSKQYFDGIHCGCLYLPENKINSDQLVVFIC